MKNTSLAYLRKRKNFLVKKLSSLGGMVIRGSLIERYKRCGKPRCTCIQGLGHGPKYYLSRSIPGNHPKMEYIARKNKETIQAYIQNYTDVKKLLGEICEINLEFHRRGIL
jgi:hypothetical protein